jgi:NarL family two-component system response regulator LiaR
MSRSQWEGPAAGGAAAGQTRIALVDGDPLARCVIRAELARHDGYTIVGEADDVRGAVELVGETRPEIVILELQLPAQAGVRVIEQLLEAAPGIEVLVFSLLDIDSELALDALRVGACGVIPKDQRVDAIVQALDAVRRGEPAIPRRLVLRMIERLRGLPDAGIGMRPVRSRLTTREWEVLDLMARGAGTREMAAAMFVSDVTVYSHVKNIMRKLGVHSRAEALAAIGTETIAP